MRENNSKKWSQALRFVQFQKNSCHHRVIQHSPYSVLFGQEPKIGLLSTALHPSIFNVITTEEELLKSLGLPLTDEDETVETKLTREIEDNHSNDTQSDETANADHEEEAISYITRGHRRNKNRQDAREGQKRQGDEFLQNTQNKQLLDNLNVGDNVVSFYYIYKSFNG
jgi:hypothetical protein